jgi:hypothetical protein
LFRPTNFIICNINFKKRFISSIDLI